MVFPSVDLQTIFGFKAFLTLVTLEVIFDKVPLESAWGGPGLSEIRSASAFLFFPSVESKPFSHWSHKKKSLIKSHWCPPSVAPALQKLGQHEPKVIVAAASV